MTALRLRRRSSHASCASRSGSPVTHSPRAPRHVRQIDPTRGDSNPSDLTGTTVIPPSAMPLGPTLWAMHGDAPCIFIVGMHRSGTSATAGALAALGMASPSGSDRTSTTEWNERGNFESKRLMAVNDRLLSVLGGSWSGPPELEPGWEGDHALDDLRARAGRAFAQSFPTRPTAWKDPRSCLTLPFWRTVVTAPVAGVLVYRDPL